jgi:hypothetical protein
MTDEKQSSGVFLEPLKRRNLIKMGLAAAAVGALPATGAMAASLNVSEITKARVLPGSFPRAGIFEMHSRPIFALIHGRQSEVVVCKAYLKVQTADPYTNPRTGRRQVDAEILEWYADGISEMLGGSIHFQMSEGASRRSWVVGGKLSDYPATLNFELLYEAETPFGTLTGLRGTAKGTISSLPPALSDVVYMNKSFRVGDIDVISLICSTCSN